MSPKIPWLITDGFYMDVMLAGIQQVKRLTMHWPKGSQDLPQLSRDECYCLKDQADDLFGDVKKNWSDPSFWLRIPAAFMKHNCCWFVASLIGWVFLELCEQFFEWSWRRQPIPLICPTSWSTKGRWSWVFSRKTRNSANERRNASGSIFNAHHFITSGHFL